MLLLFPPSLFSFLLLSIQHTSRPYQFFSWIHDFWFCVVDLFLKKKNEGHLYEHQLGTIHWSLFGVICVCMAEGIGFPTIPGSISSKYFRGKEWEAWAPSLPWMRLRVFPSMLRKHRQVVTTFHPTLSPVPALCSSLDVSFSLSNREQTRKLNVW